MNTMEFHQYLSSQNSEANNLCYYSTNLNMYNIFNGYISRFAIDSLELIGIDKFKIIMHKKSDAKTLEDVLKNQIIPGACGNMYQIIPNIINTSIIINLLKI